MAEHLPANFDYFTSVKELDLGSQIWIYGSGGRGSELCQLIETSGRDLNVLGFLDSFHGGGELEGKPIQVYDNSSPLLASSGEGSLVVIASVYWSSIVEHLNPSDLARTRVYVTDLEEQLPFKVRQYFAYSGGTFVEVGGNDGLFYSNTRYLERFWGWRGLLVEGIPKLAELCRKNRPDSIVEHAALVSRDYPEKYVVMQDKGAYSSVVEGVSVEQTSEDSPPEVRAPAVTLSSLLDKHGIEKIDFLSLDVEGYEIFVLQGLDFSRHAPQMMLVETNERTGALEELISPLYRTVEKLSPTDVLYEFVGESG